MNLRQLYKRQTLYSKVRLSILAFSMIPLICLASIFLSLIYRNQVGNIQKEAYDDIQNKFYEMNNMMNTVELTAKTVWSDTSFMTEIGKNVIDNTLNAYNR